MSVALVRMEAWTASRRHSRRSATTSRVSSRRPSQTMVCGSADDDEVLAALAAAARLQRAAEALMSEAVAQVLERDDLRAHPDRVTTRHGCRNAAELVQRATRASARTASDIIATAKAVGGTSPCRRVSCCRRNSRACERLFATGRWASTVWSAWSGAFRGCLAGRVALLAADEELAAAACGEGADAAPPASADELRACAQVWAAYLDQDGAEPAESRALRKRGFTVGRRGHDGLVPVRGNLHARGRRATAAGIRQCAEPAGRRRPRALLRRECADRS